MKTIPLMAMAVLLCGPLVLGQTDCPQQPYMPLAGHPVILDPNQIALGPADANGVRKPLLLRVLTVALGQTAADKIRACDPDGDPMAVSCQDGVLSAVAHEPGTYRWTWTPQTVGVTYHWIEATDERPATNDSLTTRGTIVVIAILRNRPPVLCGGQP